MDPPVKNPIAAAGCCLDDVDERSTNFKRGNQREEYEEKQLSKG